MEILKGTKSRIKNAQTDKSRDFCLMFMYSMEDGRRNPGSRPWTFETQENPGSRPWTFTTVNSTSGDFLLHCWEVYSLTGVRDSA
jgi:hypothetical protein